MNQTPELIADFAAFARQHGLAVDTAQIEPGQLKRCPDTDRPRGSDCAYVVHFDRQPAGRIWNHRRGIEASWRPSIHTSPLSAADRLRIEATRAKRDADRAQDAIHAAQRAERIWAASVNADPRHPYLVAKGVRAFGLRQQGDDLLVPVRDHAGRLMTLQRIAPIGGKRFLLGGVKRGGYFAIGSAPAGTLLISEGYATAASLAMATGLPVAVAFDCGNLQPVALTLDAVRSVILAGA